MFSLPKMPFLLAVQERMDEMQRAFRASKTEALANNIVYGLIIIVGVVVVLVIFSMLINRGRRRRGYSSPRELFLSLCRAHKLKWSECWLMWRLARSQHLTDPARLFLEPQRFESARLSLAVGPRAAQLKSIRDRLFAQMKENGPEEAASDEAGSHSGVVLPGPSAAPELDIPPWPTTAASPPSAP
jgi:hypothetical protein